MDMAYHNRNVTLLHRSHYPLCILKRGCHRFFYEYWDATFNEGKGYLRVRCWWCCYDDSVNVGFFEQSLPIMGHFVCELTPRNRKKRFLNHRSPASLSDKSKP